MTPPDAFFPNARVVGGYDFVGDEYGEGAPPKPDPDPMDCGGHGSHGRAYRLTDGGALVGHIGGDGGNEANQFAGNNV